MGSLPLVNLQEELSDVICTGNGQGRMGMSTIELGSC